MLRQAQHRARLWRIEPWTAAREAVHPWIPQGERREGFKLAHYQPFALSPSTALRTGVASGVATSATVRLLPLWACAQGERNSNRGPRSPQRERSQAHVII